MTTIFNFQTKSGKQQGILGVFILHSLHNEPKSGYDILKEITEKTQGAWTPSKGTLYPLLTKLEDDGLIQIKQIEQRSKTVYETTNKGITQLRNIKKHAKEMEEKINQFGNLLSDIINEEKSDIILKLLQIRKLAIQLSKTKHKELQSILDTTLERLQLIAEQDMDSNI